MKSLSLRFLFFFCLSFLIFFLTVFYLFYNFYLPSRATPTNIINTQSVTEESYIQEGEKTTNFSLHKNEGFLYKTKSEGGAAVLEFLNNNPQYQPQENLLPKTSSVKGTSTLENNSQNLIPKNFIQDSFLSKVIRDLEDKYLTNHGFNLNGEHFFYNQTINNIPVFAGILAIHLRNGNEIYSIDGNLIFNQILNAEKITDDQAKEIALKKARQEAPYNIGLKIEKTERYILNLKILGFSDDETNHVTLAITVNSYPNPLLFAKRYFVDLASGNILFEQQLIYDALNRKIYTCPDGNFDNPQLTRKEGDPPTNNSEVDKSYDYFGNTYNYFKNNFSRDSYNNQGGEIKPRVDLTGVIQSQIYQFSLDCDKKPNAAWLENGDFLFCRGLTASDVIAHEYTHGVTVNTANLLYQSQAGALNESISDIFGYALDPDDWTMGEDTILGVIRRLDDPTQSKQPQPDRLFSPNYYCGKLDSGGVHINSGVLNKAFYLMTAGGNFNGCPIAGITKEKTVPIVYRALTTYLGPQSNFKAMNNGLLHACNDLYQANSNECLQVKAALQATEMDQQPETTQVGAGCPGSGVTRKTPECATNQLTPTATPTPGGMTLTPSPTPTLTPTTKQLTPTATPTPGGMTVTPTTQPNPPIDIIVENPAVPLQLGQTYDFKINIDTKGQAITRQDMNVYFNIGYLDYVDVLNGGFFTEFFNVSRGQNSGTIFITAGLNTPKSGRGIVAIIKLSVKSLPPPGAVLISVVPIYPSIPPHLPSPLPTNDVLIDLKLKFQGIVNMPKSELNQMKIKIIVRNENYLIDQTLTSDFVTTDGITWHNGIIPFNIPPGLDYTILIKGPKHIQKKICDQNPIETYPGTYHCSQGKIRLNLGTNNLDFSNIYQLVGDLPEQDGVVNSYDVSLIRNNLNKTDAEALKLADLNLDGIVNTQDYSLIIEALSIRADEE